MTDIVERLRELQEDESQVVGTDPRDAADEIERLRKEIEQLLKAHAAYEQAITKIEDEWHHE